MGGCRGAIVVVVVVGTVVVVVGTGVVGPVVVLVGTGVAGTVVVLVGTGVVTTVVAFAACVGVVVVEMASWNIPKRATKTMRIFCRRSRLFMLTAMMTTMTRILGNKNLFFSESKQ